MVTPLSHLGSNIFTPSPHPSTNKLKTSLFAGAVAGTVVFIIVVITLFVCERRRRNKPLKVARGFEGVTFTAVSMRDRIRAETIRALDESKVLSLFNPDDMRQVPLSSVEYIRDLGSGNFGLVFLGKFYLNIKRKTKRILVVVVKWHNRANDLLPKHSIADQIAKRLIFLSETFFQGAKCRRPFSASLQTFLSLFTGT
ncbi:unnamed protein product [Porites evermanni]|uniref:Protein kinase domain-containing protein n=1 Tax=Porites evermanni TaxID=104178 RepID=A0ABN8PWR7_9CNID|nr:unnamed protein product [Porites evermanni]